MHHLFLCGDFAGFVKACTQALETTTDPLQRSNLLINRASAHVGLKLYRHGLRDSVESAKYLEAHTSLAVGLRAFELQIKCLLALNLRDKALIVWESLRNRVEESAIDNGETNFGCSAAVDLEQYLSLKTAMRKEEERHAPFDSFEASLSPVIARAGHAVVPKINKRREKFGIVSSLHIKLSEAYKLVNEGKLVQALVAFDELLALHPQLTGANIGKGSVYAIQERVISVDRNFYYYHFSVISIDFQGKYQEAIREFTVAVRHESDCVDAWQRLGQTMAALGKLDDALCALNVPANLLKVEFEQFPVTLEALSREDIERCVEAAEVYYHRGVVHHRLGEQQLALIDIDLCISLTPKNANAHHSRGVILSACGDNDAAHAAYDIALKHSPMSCEFLVSKAQCYREQGKAKEALAYFTKAIEIVGDPKSIPRANAYELRGLLWYLLGNASKSVSDYTSTLTMIDSNKTAWQMRGTAFASLGQYRLAVQDFDVILQKLGSREHIVFFNKELALFVHHHLETELAEFDFDRFLDPTFKDIYLKRGSCASLPNYKLQPTFNSAIQDVQLKELTGNKKILVNLGEQFGHLLQYDCPGFLSNSRQHRMFGIAIIHIGQTFRSALQSNKPSSPRGCCIKWRDLMNICVKWRQLSEPNDPVFWIDLLDQESFNAGFGLQTPIINGHLKVVRYYPYFNRCFSLMKLRLEETKRVNMSKKDMDSITTVEQVHDLLGGDFFVTTDCLSSKGGPTMEGTRLTVQRISKSLGYRFTIRTPGIPERWNQFDAELTSCFHNLTAALGASSSPTSAEVLSLSLRFYFYWVNFGPLSRGTAACGLVVLHGFLLGFGYRVESPIPSNHQIDWEAITTPDPKEFIKTVATWFKIRPVEKFSEYPSVCKTFNTVREAIQAINF